MKKWELALLSGFICACVLTNFGIFAQNCAQVRADTLRLHVLANSDSEADQAMKLQVRDAILQQYGGAFAEAGSKEQAAALSQQLIEAIGQTAVETLVKNGIDEPVAVELEHLYFDTKDYGEFVLPAGEYDALRVEIGAAEGKNWFCVMYPPLCLPAAGEGARLEVYSKTEKTVLQTPYNIKFAAVEWVEKLKQNKE